MSLLLGIVERDSSGYEPCVEKVIELLSKVPLFSGSRAIAVRFVSWRIPRFCLWLLWVGLSIDRVGEGLSAGLRVL
jgi:hypothetical protein